MAVETGVFKIAQLIRLNRDDSLKALVDIVVDGNVMIRGVKVIEGRNGVFVGMPGRQGSDGKWYDIVYPFTNEAKEELNETILSAYQKETE